MSQTSKLPKIKIMGATGKRTFIPLTHNVYSTQKVGKITPYMCRFMDPNSKAKINLETLEYNSPMVAPTVGDIRLKHWLYFVGLDKLSPQLANMLSKMPAVNAGGTEFSVQHVPSIDLRDLTALCLIGSYCTFYFRDFYDAPASVPREFWQTGGWNLFSSNNSNKVWFAEPLASACNVGLFKGSTYGDINSIFNVRSSDYLGGMRSWIINAKFLRVGETIQSQGEDSTYIPIPLANPSNTGNCFVDWMFPLPGVQEGQEEPVYNGEHENMTMGVDCSPVDIEHNDYAVTRSFTYADENGTHNISIRFCFRFSDFGRALRDVMIASGYQLDMSSTKRVSFMPFLATYLAYFECQSLQLFRNWQNTAAYKIIRRWEVQNVWNLSDSFKLNDTSIDRRLFVEFINDLASMWCIEPQDFVSCHTREPIVSPLVFNNLDQFINNVSENVSGPADGVPIEQDTAIVEPGTITGNNQPYISHINHDVVTAELLRKLYLRSSVNSIVGRKITSLLKENGFGDWVDLQKATFIDYGEMRLDLKPVVATADTSTSDGKGADLGQYGGRGYGHKQHKPKTFVNKVGGYYVLLTTIYVDAGYCQSIDPYNFQTEPDQFYRREFDSLGFELDEVNQVHGSLTDVQDGDFDALNKSFGFAPRNTRYKHIHNKLLGYFTNGELSDVYETYHLEKLLPVGKTSFTNPNIITAELTSDGGRLTMWSQGARFAPDKVPIAGNIWRYLGRYPWLGRFDRIFKLQDYDITKVRGVFGIDSENFFETVSKIYSYFVCSPENYTCLNTIWFDSWQDKKPISESFGTLSQIFEGFATATVNKE